jgi:hypothetical protein
VPKWLDRILGREQTQTVVGERWPDGLPVTPENIQKLAQDYHIYLQHEGYHLPITDDGDEFDSHTPLEERTADERDKDLIDARYICRKQPHCRRALGLYVSYVFGADFSITLKPIEGEVSAEKHKKVAHAADAVWKQTLKSNRRHWGPNEFCRRTYRDGEQFTRFYPVSVHRSGGDPG